MDRQAAAMEVKNTVIYSAWELMGVSVRKCCFEEATFDLGFEV